MSSSATTKYLQNFTNWLGYQIFCSWDENLKNSVFFLSQNILKMELIKFSKVHHFFNSDYLFDCKNISSTLLKKISEIHGYMAYSKVFLYLLEEIPETNGNKAYFLPEFLTCLI